jgi:two-component system, sensor histidine kinase and response regulator
MLFTMTLRLQRRWDCLRAVVVMLLAFSATGPIPIRADTPSLTHTRVRLKWRHQFQFAGHYAAIQQGFYRNAGLEVELQEASEQALSPLDSVLKGQSEFAIGGTDLVCRRAAGVPIVALAAIFQHSPVAIAGRRDRHIVHIADLSGKRLSLEPDIADLLALLKTKDIGAGQFTNTFNESGFDLRVKDLIDGRIDGMSVYLTDELFSLKQASLDYVPFSPRDAGIDFYSDILFTTEEFVAKNPQLVRKFRDATLKGWGYAMAHKPQIVQLILDKYSTRHSPAHLQFEAEQMAPLLEPQAVELGFMSRPRWQSIIAAYRGLGMLSGEVGLDRFLYAPPRLDTITR